MAAWHRSRRADLGLRASGLLLCGIAYTALSRLCAMPLSPDTVGALAFALAAIGLLAASAGSAMAALGHHLFDQIKVSERWQPRTHDVILPIETAKAIDMTDPARLASQTAGAERAAPSRRAGADRGTERIDAHPPRGFCASIAERVDDPCDRAAFGPPDAPALAATR